MKKILTALLLSFAIIANAQVGNTNNGTSTDSIGQYINLTVAQASSNMLSTNLMVKVFGISGRYKFAVYSGNATGPSTFLVQSSQLTNPASGWYSVSIPSFTFTNGQYYWFASWSDSTSAQMYYSAGGNTRWETAARTYGTWPTTLTMNAGGAALNYCIYAAPQTVTTTNLSTPNRVTLAWDPSPDASVVGYKIYLGPTSAGYTNSVTFGNVTNAVISNLVASTTYYFAATAYDGVGLESDFSNETSYTVPTPPTNTPPAMLQNFRFF